MRYFASTCDRIVVDRDYVVKTLSALEPDLSGFVDLKAINRMSHVRYQGVWACTQRLADVLGLADHQMLSVRAFIGRFPAGEVWTERRLTSASLTPAEESVVRRLSQWIRKEGSERDHKAFFCSNLNEGKCFVATSRR